MKLPEFGQLREKELREISFTHSAAENSFCWGVTGSSWILGPCALSRFTARWSCPSWAWFSQMERRCQVYRGWRNLSLGSVSADSLKWFFRVMSWWHVLFLRLSFRGMLGWNKTSENEMLGGGIRTRIVPELSQGLLFNVNDMKVHRFHQESYVRCSSFKKNQFCW